MNNMSASRKVVPGRFPFTWRKLVIAGAAAVLAPAMTASSAADRPDSISWTLETNGSRKSGSEVQLTIDSRWGAGNQSTWSNSRNIGELHDLSPAQLMGGTQPVRFALIKEAGRLDCSGTAGGGRGS